MANEIMMRMLSDSLSHAYTPEQKHEYNVKYYRENKDKYWPSSKNKAKAAGGMSDFDKQFEEAQRRSEEFRKRNDALRKQIDAEAAEQQKKAAEFKKHLEEEANKTPEQRVREQLTEMKNYLKSDEFKQNATVGLRLAKQVLPELMRTAVSFVNENRKQLVNFGKSLVNSLFSR